MENDDVQSFLPVEASVGNEVDQWIRSPITEREKKFAENHRMELVKIESIRRRMFATRETIVEFAQMVHGDFASLLNGFHETEMGMAHLDPEFRRMLRQFSRDMAGSVARFDAQIIQYINGVFRDYTGRDITPTEVVEYVQQQQTFWQWLRSRSGGGR